MNTLGNKVHSRSVAAIACLIVSLQVHAAEIDKLTIYAGSATPGNTFIFEQDIFSFPAVAIFLPAYLDPSTSAADFPIPQRPTFTDNCDAVTKIQQIEDYIQAACNTAAIFSFLSTACLSEVNEIVAGTIALLDDAGVPGPEFCPNSQFPLLPPQIKATTASPPCGECDNALFNIDSRLTEMQTFAAICQQTQKNAADHFVLVAITVFGGNPFPPDQLACHRQIAANYATEAFELDAVLQTLPPIIDSQKPICTLAMLEAACDGCGGLSSAFGGFSNNFFIKIIGNGNVQEVDGAATLDPIMDIIAEAMDAERDPDVADRLFRLLRRIVRAQRFDSVRHIMYGTDQPEGQVFVAVRKRPATEDDACFDDPAVVIISALGRDAQLPEANIIDGERLNEGLRAFAQTLIPAPRPRPSDRDGDDGSR